MLYISQGHILILLKGNLRLSLDPSLHSQPQGSEAAVLGRDAGGV